MSEKGHKEIPPGTIAHLAIEYLKTLDQGVELSSYDLAERIGHRASGIGQYLSPAVRAGLLAKRIEGHFAFWKLGPNVDSTLPPAGLSPAELEEAEVRHVSALAVPSVFAYAAQRGAAPFSAALSTDGRLTAERHGRVIAEFTDEERRHLLEAAQMVVAA